MHVMCMCVVRMARAAPSRLDMDLKGRYGIVFSAQFLFVEFFMFQDTYEKKIKKFLKKILQRLGLNFKLQELRNILGTFYELFCKKLQPQNPAP